MGLGAPGGNRGPEIGRGELDMVASQRTPWRGAALAVALSTCLFAPASGYLGMSPVLRGSVGRSLVARQPVRVWNLARVGRTPGAKMMSSDAFSDSGVEPSGSTLGAGEDGQVESGSVAMGNLMKVKDASSFFEEPEDDVQARCPSRFSAIVFSICLASSMLHLSLSLFISFSLSLCLSFSLSLFLPDTRTLLSLYSQ